MSDTSLKDLPEPDVKNKKITLPRNTVKQTGNKNVQYLDEILDDTFLKRYFEQKSNLIDKSV
tara:strand:+ start:1908 stop:2093 length:186 start_codon:yes stop_codon:yes gene_type:complete